MFRLLKFAHVNPLYLFLLFTYGLTRLIEWLTDTTETWTSFWNIIAPLFDQYKFLSYILGLPALVIALHWIYVGISIIYKTVKNSELLRRFIRSPQTDDLDVKDQFKLANIVILNQLVILPSTMILNLYFLKFANEPNAIDFLAVPSFTRMFYRLFVSMIMYEILNFYVHWMLHHPLIYKQVQMPNFEATGALGVAKIHQYPIEYILLSIIPPSLALSVSRSDTITTTIFMIAIILGPFFEQYALKLPFLASNESSDYLVYHYCSDCCGTNSMMDFFQGTYDTYIDTKNFEKHRILLSMKFSERKSDD